MKKDINKLHFWYVTGILSLIIIGLLTCKWGSIPELVSYLTFGLTLSSLILSLIAIIYTMYSNTSFIQSIGTLQQVSTSLSNDTSQLTNVVEKFEKKFDGISSDLKNIGTKFEKGQEEIIKKMSLPKQTDSLPLNLTDLNIIDAPGLPDTKTNEQSLDVFIKALHKYFFQVSVIPLTGLLALYTCQLAQKKIFHSKLKIYGKIFMIMIMDLLQLVYQ